MHKLADQLRGTFPALVTPFDESGATIDEFSFGRLIQKQLQAKVNGLVVCGSTGEALSLTLEEYERAIAVARECAGRQTPIIAGISQSSTARAVEAGRIAKKAGADGLLVAGPPYVKPSQEGICLHIRQIAEATGLPIVAYNIPSRSASSFAPATIVKLFNDKLIIGCKDATGSLDNVLDLLTIAPAGLRVLSGEDSLVWPIMSCGGCGIISASANVAPEQFVAMTNAALAGDGDTARRIQLQLLPLLRSLFLETNPVPAKAALWLQGIIATPAVRPPLIRAKEKTIQQLKERLAL